MVVSADHLEYFSVSELGVVGMNEVSCIFVLVHPDIQLHLGVLNLPSHRIQLGISKFVSLVYLQRRTQ